MALNLTLKDIGYELFGEIDSDSNFSEASIVFFLRNAIGDLNNKINTSFTLDETTLEFSPNINEQQKAILKQLFFCYYFNFGVRKSLGAASVTATLLSVDDTLGGKVRFINKNDQAKLYKDLGKDAENTLKDMIAQYKINVIEPLDIQGKENTESVSLIDPYQKRRCW